MTISLKLVIFTLLRQKINLIKKFREQKNNKFFNLPT